MNKHIQIAIKNTGGQKQLAAILGCKQSFVSFMLNGLKEVPPEMCRKIEFINNGKSPADKILPKVFLKITSLQGFPS